MSPDQVRVAGLLGTGSVGSGWAAAYLGRGCEVLAYDPSPNAPEKVRDFLARSWPALCELGAATGEVPFDKLRFASLAEVAAGADVLHENAPERIDVKRDLLKDAEREAAPWTVICSSSGGLKPSDIQAEMSHPNRLVVAHPFNPPHLVPLVEVVGGRTTAPATADWAMALMRRLGKRPIRLDREMTAYMANRLQFALLREAIHCLVEGVASPQDIDDAVRYGLAPRWAVLGPLMTFTLAGGPGGMPHVLAQFSESTEAWWADLGETRLTPDVRDTLVTAAETLADDRALPDWMALRDRHLVRVLQLLDDLSSERP